LSAIKAMLEVLQKLKEIPQELTFVVDGNPIYLLAQHFFVQHDIAFDVKQVIGPHLLSGLRKTVILSPYMSKITDIAYDVLRKKDWTLRKKRLLYRETSYH
jgi:hypothetical protein